MELLKKYFSFQMPTEMLNTLYNSNKNNSNTLVNVIKSGLSDLKNEIEKISEDEIIIEKTA